MDRHSIRNTVDKCRKKLNDESKLCLGAAVGCFLVGTVGWLVNLVAPETTTLHGLLVVAVFYSAIGFLSLFKKPTAETQSLPASPSVNAPRVSFQGHQEKNGTLKSAA